MTLPGRLNEEQSRFLENANLQRLFDIIETAGGEARVNGGAVRNALLGQPIAEIDISTDLVPDEVLKAVRGGDGQAVPTGIEHGTVTAVINGEAFEITTLREDIETDGRRAKVRFGKDWKSDALRRDFTMNALYCDRRGTLFDPVGGYGDLKSRIVRFIGDPDQRIAEDRLRILRFFRFFAWYGSERPDAESLKACVRHRNELDGLSAERVWNELRKLLSAPDPSRAILWMRTAQVLSQILPETAKWGVDLLPSLVAVRSENGEPHDPLLRLMSMIPPDSARVSRLCERLKMSNAEAHRLVNWASVPKLPATFDDAELSVLLYRGEPQAIVDTLWLERARRSSNGKDQDQIIQMIRFAEGWHRPEFPVKGRDLLELGYKPGRQLGKTLARLEELWINSVFSLDKSALTSSATDPAAATDGD